MTTREKFTVAVHGLTPTFVEAAAAIALGIAALAAWAGGWHAEVWGATISVRAVWRPLVIAAVLAVARWLLIRDRVGRLAQFSDASARVVAGSVLAAGLLAWTTYLSPYLGGADSYGYVSAAERLREGALIRPEPLAAMLPYPEAVFAATPLGYVPAARVAGASVPAYPLGLPALMAVAATIGGPRAPFYVPLLMGLVLVGVCHWIAFRWTGDRVIALAASAAVAFHPVVFAYAIQAMSDVPATALYLLAAACLMHERGSMAFLGGMAGGLAMITRPALLPGVAALALVPLMTGVNRRRRIAVFALVLGVSVVVQLWLQWYLYGHPLGNGYGGTTDLFALSFLPANARSYGYWAIVMHGPIWILGLLLGVLRLRERSARAVLAAAVVGALLPHAFYRPYDHWETLRFILPLLVVGTIDAVIGLFTATLASPKLAAELHASEGGRRSVGPRTRNWIGLTLVIVMIAFWVRWLDRAHVLQLARAEERFRQAGDLVERATPDQAVVLASLHSGSLRYYAHRQTLDWARIPDGQFDATVAALSARGRPVFVMLDGDEERVQFEARHAHALERWLPAGQRRDIRLYESPAR